MAVEMMNGGVAIALETPSRNVKRAKGAYGNSNAERQKPRKTAEERFEENKARINKAVSKDGGKYVSFEDSGIGILVCGVVCDKKFYFLWMDKDRKIVMQSMKDTYRMCREIPGSLSVLDYLYQHQRDGLREMVDMWLEDNTDCEVVTDIAIKAFKPRNNGGKNGKNGGKPFNKKGGKNTNKKFDKKD